MSKRFYVKYDGTQVVGYPSQSLAYLDIGFRNTCYYVIGWE